MTGDPRPQGPPAITRFRVESWRLGVLLGYLLLLHAALAAYVLRDDVRIYVTELVHDDTWNGAVPRCFDAQRRTDFLVPAGTALFLGDSLVAGLGTTAVADKSLNYGVAGATTTDLLGALPRLRSLARARAIYLEIGINDLGRRQGPGIEERYRRLLAWLPAGTPLVWTALMPTPGPRAGLDETRAVNRQIRALCAARPGCTFVDSWAFMTDAGGRPRAAMFQADGIHLSPGGYRAWIAALHDAAPETDRPPAIRGS